VIRGRVDEARALGRGWALREGSSEEESGVVRERNTPEGPWHPTVEEREAVARWIVSGETVTQVSKRIGKSESQIKYCLRNEKTQEAVARESDAASQHVGFAMARLQLELPKLLNNMLAMAHDPDHGKHYDANKYCIDTVMRPHLNEPDQGISINVELAPQLNALVQVAVESYSQVRELTPRDDIKNIPHLRQGKDGVLSRHARGVTVERDDSTPDAEDVVDFEDVE
jgi:hypothetical protein